VAGQKREKLRRGASPICRFRLPALESAGRDARSDQRTAYTRGCSAAGGGYFIDLGLIFLLWMALSRLHRGEGRDSRLLSPLVVLALAILPLPNHVLTVSGPSRPPSGMRIMDLEVRNLRWWPPSLAGTR